MKVLAIDPGVMSGYCYAEIVDKKLTYYPFQITDDVWDLWDRLKQFDPRYVVMEDFEFRRGKGGINLFPVQLIGVARLFTTVSKNCAIYLQKASTGKAYYSDTVLKQLGVYKRGVPHGMDASRHLLQWCMFGAGNQYIGRQSTEEFATIADRMEWWRV